MHQTGAADTDNLLKQLNEGAKQERSMLDNSLNLNFNPRADIIKDNPNDVNQRSAIRRPLQQIEINRRIRSKCLLKTGKPVHRNKRCRIATQQFRRFGRRPKLAQFA